MAATAPGSTHDFATDPIRILRDGDELRADGTTLGADDGIGVSIAMAILDSSTVRHPDLEILLTTGEESGLLGAKALAPGSLLGRYLLNLDGEQDGVFLTSCAGGATFDVSFPIGAGAGEREHLAPAYEVHLVGLAGGHSGLDIDKGRTNAIHAVSGLLSELAARAETPDDVRLAHVDAPGAFNAIAREARVLFTCSAGDVAAAIVDWQRRLAVTEPAASVAIRILEEGADCLAEAASRAVLSFLCEVPDGVFTMSEHLPGLVESSLNTGVLRQDDDALTVTLSTRSSDAARHEELAATIAELAHRHGASVRRYGEYPAWQFDPDNPLLAQAVDVYTELFGAPPTVTGIHGGLECGVLSKANPQVAMLSVGADLRDCHTPAERASVASIERLLRLVVGVVETVR